MMARLPAHLADDVEHLGPVVVAVAALLDDGQRRVEELGEGAGALGEAQVRDHDQVLELLLEEVVAEQVDGGQLVDGDVEEALDLALVEVHGEQPVGAGDLIMSAMRRAVMGTRGWSFLSERP